MKSAVFVLACTVVLIAATPVTTAPDPAQGVDIEALKEAGPNEHPPVETLFEVPMICSDCSTTKDCKYQWAARSMDASRMEDKPVLHTVTRKTYSRTIYDVVRCAPKMVNAATDSHLMVVQEPKPVQVIQEVPAFFQVVPFSVKQPFLKYQLKQ